MIQPDEPFLTVISSPPPILSLPVEVLILIVENLHHCDLLNITQVNRYMADKTCELYLARCGIRLFGQSVSVREVGFKPLSVSVWRRSPAFKEQTKKSLMCWFDSNLVEAESQIQSLQTFLATLPSPVFHTIHLRHLAPVSPVRLLGLLDSIDRSGILNVQVHAHMVSHENVTVTQLPSSIYMHATKTLQFRFADLSVVNWTFLLKHITAPSLEKLMIGGDASVYAISHFLRRHCYVSAVEFTGASNLRSYMHPSSHLLHLPTLHSLSGSLRQVIPLLETFSSTPRLERLHLDSVTELQYGTWINEVMRCLAFCTGSIQLIIGFTPSSPPSNGHVGFSRRRHRKQEHISPSVVSLMIEVQHLSDDAILVRMLGL